MQGKTYPSLPGGQPTDRVKPTNTVPLYRIVGYDDQLESCHLGRKGGSLSLLALSLPLRSIVSSPSSARLSSTSTKGGTFLKESSGTTRYLIVDGYGKWGLLHEG